MAPTLNVDGVVGESIGKVVQQQQQHVRARVTTLGGLANHRPREGRSRRRRHIRKRKTSPIHPPTHHGAQQGETVCWGSNGPSSPRGSGKVYALTNWPVWQLRTDAATGQMTQT